jgi:hypothetical protein
MSGVEGSAAPLPRRDFMRRAGLVAGGAVVAGRDATALPTAPAAPAVPDVSRRPGSGSGFDVTMDLPAPDPPCTLGAKGGATPGNPFDDTTQAMADLQNSRFKIASERPWSQAT